MERPYWNLKFKSKTEVKLYLAVENMEERIIFNLVFVLMQALEDSRGHTHHSQKKTDWSISCTERQKENFHPSPLVRFLHAVNHVIGAGYKQNFLGPSTPDTDEQSSVCALFDICTKYQRYAEVKRFVYLSRYRYLFDTKDGFMAIYGTLLHQQDIDSMSYLNLGAQLENLLLQFKPGNLELSLQSGHLQLGGRQPLRQLLLLSLQPAGRRRLCEAALFGLAEPLLRGRQASQHGLVRSFFCLDFGSGNIG